MFIFLKLRNFLQMTVDETIPVGIEALDFIKSHPLSATVSYLKLSVHSLRRIIRKLSIIIFNDY